MKPIVLFGGTYDPVHYGHVTMAFGATPLLLEKIILLPAGNPYQRGRLPFASGEDRVAMLELAFKGFPAPVEIDPRELARQGPTYTIDTLLEMRREVGPEQSLVWLMGSDAFAKLDTWHRWQELFTLAHFAVLHRKSEPPALTVASGALQVFLRDRNKPHRTLDTPAGNYVFLPTNVPDISSTDIRARIAKHESIRELVQDAVCDYIEQHKLYRSEEKNQVGH